MSISKFTTGETKPSSGAHRFVAMCDLHSRYKDSINNFTKKESWENIVKMYEAWPYASSEDEGGDPNFGLFKNKLNSEIERLEGILLHRDRWCKIHTYEGKTKKQRSEWSESIESAFYNHAIFPWSDRHDQIRLGVKDVVMFGKSASWWKDGSYRPICADIKSVIPDSSASPNPDTFELLFVEENYSVGELYEILAGERIGEYESGWNDDVLSEYIDNIDSDTTREIGGSLAKKGRGELSHEINDLTVKLVHAYVKEYRKVDGKSISHYIFPEDGVISTPRNSSGDNEEKRFLFSSTNSIEKMSDVIGIRTNVISRSYWEMSSFGESLFLSCKFYDNTMIKIIRAVLRNMVLFISSSDAEQQERFSGISGREVQILGPGDKIEQQRVSIDISPASNAIRQLMFDADSTLGVSIKSGSQNVKGGAITAEEAKQNAAAAASRSDSASGAFSSSDHRIVETIYRKFVSGQHEDELENECFKRFKAELQEMGVPDSAWDIKNVLISPNHLSSLSSPASRIEAARQVLSALRSNPMSKGEFEAVKEVIAALYGYDSVPRFMDDHDVIDSEFVLAGIESEVLTGPDTFEKNVAVLPTNSHITHMTVHLADLIAFIEKVSARIHTYDKSPDRMKSIILNEAAKSVESMDLKISHMLAHISVSERTKLDDTRIANLIPHWRSEIHKQRLEMQAIINFIKSKFEEMASSSSDDVMLNAKERHIMSMYEIEERHAKAMSDIKLGTNVEKANFNLDVSKARRGIELADASIDAESKRIQAEGKIAHSARKADIEISSLLEKNRVTLEKERQKIDATK